MLAERDEALTEANLAKMFDVSALAESEDISQAAAQALVDKVIKPAYKALQAKSVADSQQVRQALAQSEDRFKEQLGATNAQTEKLLRRQTNREILSKHSDFLTIKDSNAFKEFLLRSPPGSRTPFGEDLAAAYADGDADFINATIDVFKAGKPNVMDIADVKPTPSTSAKDPAPQQDKSTYTYDDLTEKRYAMQRGEISKKQYSEWIAAFKKADAEGRVS